MADNGASFCELMRRVHEGSDDAAWELVEHYGDAIRRAVRRTLNQRLRSKFDSLDFVQLVWNSLFRVRSKLRHFNRPEELAAYLVTMARNKVGMEVRKRLLTEKYNVNRECSLQELAGTERTELRDRQPGPLDVAIAREQWSRLLRGQPDHYRQIIHLRLQGHTYQDIAELLHLDECTVRRFVKRLLCEIAT
jgi:RNA polymerase sigma factor (sigma-70 family)